MRRMLLSIVLVPCLVAAQDTPGVRYSRFIEQAGKEKDQAKALELYRLAQEIESRDGSVWLSVGGICYDLKRYDECIEAYKQALRFGGFENKFVAVTEFDIACCYALKDDKKSAWEWLDKSLAHGFRDLGQVRTDPDLKSLHGDKRWEEVAATKDTSKMGRVEGWRYDLWLMDREVRRIHYAPYRVTSKAELDKYVKELHAAIPKLTDEQVAVRFIRYMAMIGDGHTGIRVGDGPMRAEIPLRFYVFEDGVFCHGSNQATKAALGLKLVKVEGRSIDELREKITPYIRRDNETGIDSTLPYFLIRPSYLYGIGLAKSPDYLDFTFQKADGGTVDMRFEKAEPVVESTLTYANSVSSAPVPLYMRNLGKAYWFEILPETKTLYFQYNSVRNDPEEQLWAFADRVMREADQAGVENIVLDTRFNSGGNTFLSTPLVKGLAARPKLTKNGHMFIITGRQTFSACQNFVTDLGRLFEPIYVGEPTGSSPNFVGETVGITLPFSKMTGSISDLYWQRSWPMDHRTAIVPDLPAPPRMDMFLQNRDPAMEAVMEFLKAG